MSKKKEIERLNERLKDENSRLRERILDLQTADVYKREENKELRIMLQEAKEDFDQRYAELLEKYITMMERMVRLNEQREAD